MKCVEHKYMNTDPLFWMIHSNFEEFEHIPTKTEFNYAYSIPANNIDIFRDYDNLVIDWYEEPNCLVVPGAHEGTLINDSKIKKLFAPDKYSVDCYNKMNNTDKWQLVFYPFNVKNIPNNQEKIYDIYYTGNAISPISFAYQTMEKFKSCFVCTNYGNHRNVGYKEKLNLNAQSKISITHCLLIWPQHYYNIAAQYPLHYPLQMLNETGGKVPQFKTRVLEAAASKSLILNYFDAWREIEDYFTPDVDFIYWYNINDLEEKIVDILNNYEKYQPMIENAYIKLINNFTTKHYFEKFLKPL